MGDARTPDGVPPLTGDVAPPRDAITGSSAGSMGAAADAVADVELAHLVEVARAAFAVQLGEVATALPERINADPERVEQGLARLVLTLVEVLRKTLEHQAVRRMDGGSLSDEEVERLGLALLRLDQRMGELKSTFGLTDDDLKIDLGPLQVR